MLQHCAVIPRITRSVGHFLTVLRIWAGSPSAETGTGRNPAPRTMEPLFQACTRWRWVRALEMGTGVGDRRGVDLQRMCVCPTCVPNSNACAGAQLCGTRVRFGYGRVGDANLQRLCSCPTCVPNSNACAGAQTPQTYRRRRTRDAGTYNNSNAASGSLGTGEQARWISAPKPGCSMTLRPSSSGPEQTPHRCPHSNQTPTPVGGRPPKHSNWLPQVAHTGGRSSRTPPVSDMTSQR